MKHGKRELPRQRKPLLTRVLLTTLVLGLAVVGVAAYLSHSSNKVENTFGVEEHPVVTVSGTEITVTDPDYAVYLRAAVVINWVNTSNGKVLAEMPAERTDYTLSSDDKNWVKGDDGFYYYTQKITQGASKLSPVTVTEMTTKTGYVLKVSVAAQTVQAVGETDDDTMSAVEHAWGEAAAKLIEGTS